MRFTMYPDSRYNGAHAQSVCTRPFSPRWEGPGDEARTRSILQARTRENIAWSRLRDDVG